MDKDLSGARAERNVLQSLHDTQSDHTKRLTRLETKMDAVEGRLGAVEGQLEAVKTTLKTVHAGVDLINSKLDSLIRDDR